MKKLYKFYTLILAAFICSSAYSLPILNSLPSAPLQKTIYLDFDGHYVLTANWNNGNPINCAPAGMTDAQITEVFNRVAEDFRPFDLNVTTDSTRFLSAPLLKRIRIIITPTSAWRPGVGGVAWIGSFTWGDDTPAFVFNDRLPVGGPVSPKLVAEASSHESGHTLALSHQSKYGANCFVPDEVYHSGFGTGPTSWAPVMGNSYSRNMTGWNNGATNWDCNDLQDNLFMMTAQNEIDYRTDDYTEVLDATATILGSGTINRSGIITTETDKDAFRIVLGQNSNVNLQIKPYSVGINDDGANLDVKVILYNNAGATIRTYDPMNGMSVTMDTILNAGTYYIRVDGTGNNNASEYGSLGSYTITGATGALPIRSIVLTGNNNNNKHNLSWTIIADEKIKEVTIEASYNGVDFAALQSFEGNPLKFAYQPYNANTVYYRLKVTSVIHQTAYSNIIALRANGFNGKKFEVSSFVNNDITVNASGSYQYRISDANGRMVSNGNGTKGINRINISNQPNGLYTIQIISNNEIQSDRIIKQ